MISNQEKLTDAVVYSSTRASHQGVQPRHRCNGSAKGFTRGHPSHESGHRHGIAAHIQDGRRRQIR